ncbi:hypothetical protein [Streptomyces sp. NPDC046909]|uniref:hypothetical protein n=1 Tax=Streptomyces sp. NPDC046909 TaxID=3155617 RepID=UPI0033FDA108
MTAAPRSARLLVLATVVLAAVGTALLLLPHGPERPAVDTSPASGLTWGPGPSPAAAAPSADAPTTEAAPSASLAAAPSSGAATVLAPHGEGAAGDEAIQRALATAWPADLPAADERELLALGRALLRADATGVGRSQWPKAFPDAQAAAAAFATDGFRVQAALARRDGSPDKAVVHLVWAATDRGGTSTDLRITD